MSKQRDVEVLCRHPGHSPAQWSQLLDDSRDGRVQVVFEQDGDERADHACDRIPQIYRHRFLERDAPYLT